MADGEFKEEFKERESVSVPAHCSHGTFALHVSRATARGESGVDMLLSQWPFGRLKSEKNDGRDSALPAPGDGRQEGRGGAACRSDSCF